MINNECYNAYDFEYSHIVNEIITPISIYSSPYSAEGSSLITDALWDTGATHSVLSLRIANELNLLPVDNVYIGGIDGNKSSNVVMVTVTLPNNMVLTGRRFYVSNIPGADVLIGMDIISMGDFNISNAYGKTLFSFVIPPFKSKISYTKLVTETP